MARPDCTCGCGAAERTSFLDWVGRLVHDHRGLLVRVARGEGLGAEDAFDVVQEAFHTFLTLPVARTLVDAPGDSRNMLVALARNAARNRRRLAAVVRPHASEPALLAALSAEVAAVDDLLAEAEDLVRLRGCVQELAELQRSVVTLRLLDEVDGESVARTLGITAVHVAVILHRAKANLSACMTVKEEGTRHVQGNAAD